MRALSAMEVLELWERGVMEKPITRAIELLAAASPETTPEQLLLLSLGQRDMRLIALREALFGSGMEAVADCPQCAEQVELNFSTTDLCAGVDLDAQKEAAIEVAGDLLLLRPPNSADLLALDGQDLDQCCNQLLRRCVVSGGDEISAEVADILAQRIEQVDRFANIRMRILCPNCHHAWRELFDIVAFLWSEVERWARRIMRDVHTLASAYGWHEKEILALSPARRQFYLDMVVA